MILEKHTQPIVILSLLVGGWLGFPSILLGQFQFGSPFEMALFVSGGLVTDQFSSDLEVGASYGRLIGSGGYPQYMSVSGRGISYLPKRSNALITAGMYAQELILQDSFMRIGNMGANFSLALPIIPDMLYGTIGGGVNRQSWNAEWEEFTLVPYLARQYGIESVSQIGDLSQYSSDSNVDFSFNWGMQYMVHEDWYVTTGGSTKQLARHSFFSAEKDSFRSPRDFNYYAYMSYGRTPIGRNTGLRMYADIFLNYSVLYDDFGLFLFPIQNRSGSLIGQSQVALGPSRARSGLWSIGARVHPLIRSNVAIPIGVVLNESAGEYEVQRIDSTTLKSPSIPKIKFTFGFEYWGEEYDSILQFSYQLGVKSINRSLRHQLFQLSLIVRLHNPLAEERISCARLRRTW